ncbi:MAG: sterol desaturase family protein [Melioribacteraceae bacterium]|nr:sterol desaturase family protein [Melioribacteraceae bacterium]
MAKLYISNKDETVRMFDNKILEAFSRVHWTVPLYVFIPVIILNLYLGLFRYELAVQSVLLYFIFGLIIWSFTEYSLHRFIFHYNAKSEFGKKIHFIFHGVHHAYPKDSKRLVMPPSVSIPLAAVFYFLFLYILGNILLAPFFAGFITGYLIYDITHYAIHHFNMKSRLMLAIKNHHMLHHYKYDNKGFGVSQPAWDYVFGTTFPGKDEK